VPPRTPHEEAIVAIWRDVLGRSDIGVLDDFFDLNGNSLRAIQVIARIRETWGVSIRAMNFFESPTVAALASAVAAGSPSERPFVSRRPPGADPVLSFDQQRLWLENHLRPEAAYNVHGRRRLLGRLNVAAFDASIRAILVRHEALRTRFPIVDGRPVQVIDDPDENWHISVEDLADVGHDRAGAARRLADEDAAAPFDLAQGPLFRCLFIKLSDTEHVLSITAHHIICDDWSVGLFVRELSALYQADDDVLHRADLPTLPVQYRDYAVWQRRWLAGEALELQVSYWRRHLAGAPPALDLPTTEWRSPPEGAGGGRIRSALSKEETAALHELCRTYGVTSFMALLASLAAVLGRWSGQRDVVIGVPITGRTDAGTENLIGFFVNTLPLRTDLSGDPTFADLLGRVRQAALGGYAHADAPLDLLVKELQVTRVPGRTPLFQVILNVVDSPSVEPLRGVSAEVMDAPAPPSKFDLALTARESDGALQMELEFNADRYQEAMIQILLGHVGTLVREAIEDPTRCIFDYSLQASWEAVRTEISPIDRPTAAPHRAVERFAQLPDRVAVIDRDGGWSYRRLNQAADRVAHALAHQYSPHADHHLGVIRRPTAAFVAAILGCMKAGATFSVIDAVAAGPAQDPGVSAVLDVSPVGEVPEGTMDLRALLWDEADPFRTSQEGAAGSPLPSRDWAVERFRLSGNDRFTVLSRLSGHLLSALSGAFNAGATLVLPEHSFTDDTSALITWLQANSISVVYVTPPILRAIAAQSPRPQLPALRYAFIDNSGELISHDIEALRRLSATCRCVGIYRVGRDGRPLAAYAVPDNWKPETAPLRVPLGTELEDTPARLLHPSGQPGAIGEVAEISVGSYRTGDLGRRWADGTLEFVGRLGGSLAVNSVETLGALREAPEVRDAVVTEHAGTDGPTMLLGYAAGPEPTLATAGIHQHLVTRLPDYLIPQHLFVLDQIPLTPEGDYDLSALPQPHADSTPLDTYVAPRTPMEHQLTEILHELLAVDRIGIYDSFFELGGFSLLATQLASRIREIFHVELSLRDMFESATVERLAQLIVRAQVELSGAEDLEALLDEIGSLGRERG
jgi:non-ribosomal peptide synthetase component F/acyl carrier protein